MAQPGSSRSARAVSDTAKLFSARLAAGIVSILFTAWLLRVMPAEELAIWPIILAVAGIVEGLGSLGMGDTLVRRVPRYLAAEDEEAASRLLRTAVVLNVAACIAIMAIIDSQAVWTAEHLLGDAAKANVIRMAGLAALLVAIQKRLEWGLKATQQFGRIASLGLLMNSLRTPLATVMYVTTGFGGLLVAFAVVPAIGCILTVAWLWKYLWRSGGFEPLGELLRFSLPYYGVSIASILRSRAHYLVVGLLTSPEILGVFFVASKVSGYLEELNRFAVSVITPKLAEKAGVAPNARPGALGVCSRYVFLVFLPLHLGVALLAGPAIQIFAGSTYVDAAPILSVLALAVFVQLLFDVHRAHIQVYAPPVHLLWLQVIAGVADVTIMGALVFYYGALGAAAAKLVTYALMAGVAAYLLSRSMPLIYDERGIKIALRGALVLCLACGAIVLALETPVLVVLVGAALGTIAYLLSLTRQLAERDVNVLIEALPKRVQEFVEAHVRPFAAHWFVSPPSTDTPLEGVDH
ncbi:MAG: oligosaccharide flippase family protein [Armatimonadia bacterium]|nr:oligosaccharide flippase family protein [Armatimonadia bacterium]